MKRLAGLVAAIALIGTPVVAQARGGGGHGGGGGFHGGMHASMGGGGYRGGFGGYRGGFHGSYGVRGGYDGGFHGYRGGWGGWRGWGWPYYYGASLGFYLGYDDDPWYWGYPGYYYDDPEMTPEEAYAPPALQDGPPIASAPPPAQQSSDICGNWLWDTAQQQYHWVANGCN
ncbi:MAG: hypothetical protein KGJ57_18075 [Sphingomonadales bacterium]|nr:hypothetical protein [Sphingomonadales bacterium]MDE2171306.1 hypothetical protein [Sphingomonadales bacterium]